MSEVKRIDRNDILIGFDIYYCGWSELELESYQANYQATYTGDMNDLILEITTDELQLYYVIFHAGESFKNQAQFFLEKSQSILVVNANGNIYRFDIIHRKSLDNTCFSDVLFDNTQNEGHISLYLATEVSSDLGIMIVVDNEGVAAINWNKVLWKRRFNWAYADYIRVLKVTNSSVILESDPPDDSIKTFSLNITTGVDN